MEDSTIKKEEDKLKKVQDSFYTKTKQYTYYFLIGVVSFISVVFLPMIGTTVGLGWSLPDTTTGWIVWIVSRLIIAIINVMIFYSFMQQGKLNVKNDPKYQEALKILQADKNVRIARPKSPTKWQSEQYGRKGTTIFFSSALSVIAFSQAILTYSWTSMIGYIFTIVMGIVFGIMQMKKSEAYWTDEFYRYAVMIDEENKKENNDVNN